MIRFSLLLTAVLLVTPPENLHSKSRPYPDFCERNPMTCAVPEELLNELKLKSRLLFDHAVSNNGMLE